MNEDIAACAGIVQKADPDRFLAIMSGPVPLREKLFPLYAMNVEVARAPWVTKESMIAEMRLQWWRDALEEIASGGRVRRHEVVTPLAELLNAEQAEALFALVEARRWDIYKDAFEDLADFQKHLNESSGLLLSVAAQLADETDRPEFSMIGQADGLARWFQAIPALEAEGRIPLVDGRPDAISELANGALKELANARRDLGRVSPDLAAVLRTTWQAKPLLKKVSKAPEIVASDQVFNGELSKKIKMMWLSINASW